MTRWNTTQGKTRRDPLRLVEGPDLVGHSVQHSDALHLLIIDGVIVPCTPTEYPLVMHFLQQTDRQLSLEFLLQWIRQHASSRCTKGSLRRHIRSLRAKLWPFGLDILCIIGYGYMLHATSQEEAELYALEIVSLPA
jgi:DNA-binding response OmpR family regulator